jgi:hypothetical protein
VQLWHFNEQTAECTLIALLPTPAAEVRALSWCPYSLPACPSFSPACPPAFPSPAPAAAAAAPPPPCFLLAAALSSGLVEVCNPSPSHPLCIYFHTLHVLGVGHPVVSSRSALLQRASPPFSQRQRLRGLGPAASRGTPPAFPLTNICTPHFPSSFFAVCRLSCRCRTAAPRPAWHGARAAGRPWTLLC